MRWPKRSIAVAIATALGLDASQVTHIAIGVHPDGIVTATVEMVLMNEQQGTPLVRVLEAADFKEKPAA
jgi:hypothetical protein